MLKKILQKIEQKRTSKIYYWKFLITLKDSFWKVYYYLYYERVAKKISIHLDSFPDEYVESIRGCNGILHIGAHLGQEAELYNSIHKKVLWIEANPEISKGLKKTIKPFKDQKALQALITDKDNQDYTFNISNNGSEASSIYDFGEYLVGEKNLWKGLWDEEFRIEKSLHLKSKTIQTIYKELAIKDTDYDFLVLDIQGAELLALKGAGDILKNFTYIWTEVSMVEIYKGGVLLPELHSFLQQHGFAQVTPFSGNILYKQQK